MSHDPTPESSISERSRRDLLKRGALLSGGLTLPGIGSALAEETDTPTESATNGNATDTSEDEGEYDLGKADLEFANEMIAHHWQAIIMAKLVPHHSDREPLIEMANEIIEAQRNQINIMQRILREADVDYRVDNVPEGVDIPGMPTEDGMATLRALEGDEFTATFINLMTAHHRGGVILARRELEEGQSQRLQELSEKMIRVQLNQIHQMYAWYTDWISPPQTEEAIGVEDGDSGDGTDSEHADETLTETPTETPTPTEETD